MVLKGCGLTCLTRLGLDNASTYSTSDLCKEGNMNCSGTFGMGLGYLQRTIRFSKSTIKKERKVNCNGTFDMGSGYHQRS
jgi:hypothetical protein